MNEEQDPSEPQDESSEGSAKVSDELQERATEIIESATLPELDFIISEATSMKKKMMKSQGKAHLNTPDFSMEQMPQD